MYDVRALLADRPGMLAEFARVLGAAGISLEGGGVFTHDGVGVAHFLVEDGPGARDALRSAGIVAEVSEVVMLRLAQNVPGQLGLVCRRMADAGVNIRAQYSDHSGNLVLVVDDHRAAARVAAEWAASTQG